MRGLLGRSELPRGEGVLLHPAGSVHTLFMRFPIDVVFLDRDDRVLHVAADVRPWRFVGKRRARSVLELAAGEAARRGIEIGTMIDRLDMGVAPPVSTPASRTLASPSNLSNGTHRGAAATPVPEGGKT